MASVTSFFGFGRKVKPSESKLPNSPDDRGVSPMRRDSSREGDSKVSSDSAYRSMSSLATESAECLAELDLDRGRTVSSQQSTEQQGMASKDFSGRPSGVRPSRDSAMHTSSSSMGGGRGSSSTFDTTVPSCQRDTAGDARRFSSSATPRVRMSSESAATSEQSSGRSSFAMEQDPGYGTNLPGSPLRPSVELFGQQQAAVVQQTLPQPLGQQQLDALCQQLRVPPAMTSRLFCLAALQPNLPVPMVTLVHLWDLSNVRDAEATAVMFEERGIMRTACLADGSAWALVQPEQHAHLQAMCPAAAEVHEGLLTRYTRGTCGLADVTDDGYFLQAVGHHCIAAGQSKLLEGLLARPDWLHNKLKAYGVASVVSDFRRYLSTPDANPDVKLLLEAFQMALPAYTQRPTACALRAQMVARMLTASRSPFLATWLDEQRAIAAASPALEAADSPAAAVAAPGSDDPESAGVHFLIPLSASITQAGGLQRMLLRGHGAPLSALLLTPTGVDLVTGAEDGSLRLWDMEVGDCVSQLMGHVGAINALAVASSGSPLVSASADGTARVWDLQAGACTSILAGHTGSVQGVAMDVQGRYCITAAADGTARCWSMTTGACVHVLRGHGTNSATGVVHAVALTPDGRQAVTVSDDFTGRVWDLTTGECTAVLEGHTGWVIDVKVTPDGRAAITASHDGTARVWQLHSGMCMRVLRGHTGRLNAIALAEDGSVAVTASDDGTARVWRSPHTDGGCSQVLEGHRGFVTGVAVAADGQKALTISGDCLGMLWHLPSGACLQVLHGHSATVAAAVLTRKSRFGVTASQDCTARVWNLLADTSTLVPTHDAKVTALVVSPDGSQVASIADDAAAFVWDLSDGRCIAELQGHAAALRYGRFLADGRRLVTVSGDRHVNTWPLEAAAAGSAPVCNLEAAPGSRVRSFVAAADGVTAVMALFDSSVAVWDLGKGQLVRYLQKRGQHDAGAHAGGVNAVYLTPDAAHALTVSKDATARVWDLRDGSSICLTGHSDNVTAAAISRCGSFAITISDDCTARMWDVKRGTAGAALRMGAPLTHVAISADGRSAVLLADDRSAAVWDVATGQPVCRFAGHTGDVTGCAISANGALVATCSADNTLRAWDAATGQLRAFFMADTSLSCCAICEASGGTTLVAGADSGSVHFLPLPA